MTIFIRLLKIMKTIGFIVVLFFISYLMTSVAYYSRNHSEDKAYSIELIDDKNIYYIKIDNNKLNLLGYINNSNNINSYIDRLNKSNEQKGNEYIVLDIETTNIVTDEYLIAYCLSYSDKYNKEIHLNVVDKEIMINTQKNTIFILKK